MSSIYMEEYFTEDDDLLVFAGVIEEDILSEITDEMENDDDTGPSQSLLTSQEALRSVQSLWTFFQSFRPQMMSIFVH
ncbi:hypothetical protein AVEN_59143-1 [Araneus ventricosus]|uniref:Uncharacterized protein n=1 Tax=Araneus ventricosus TaxID=182803 RepID=A0A4Y2FEH4_ARAVE|nr:hypothetical protein AVEN_114430-1 [Araneus ventricosus]GBM39953.1 hypothetical protein AVEN_59143-1 [Araneus ventricosus]